MLIIGQRKKDSPAFESP